jgi:ABC-type nitrate/sulfonate/bicarbonate transport system substrate-binding protein
MAMRRLLFIAIFSVALNSLCSHFALGAAAGKIILGYASPGRALPFWVAQDVGLFNKYGVDVEPVFIRGAPILVAGLAAGDIQVGSTGGSATLAAVAGGQDDLWQPQQLRLNGSTQPQKARGPARQAHRGHQHRRDYLDGIAALARALRPRCSAR